MPNYEPDSGSDERTARLANIYNREMDEPGDTVISDVIRFYELDSRGDSSHTVRLLWDSMSTVLPLVVEVSEPNDEGFNVPMHVARVEAHEWREAFEHPFAFWG